MPKIFPKIRRRPGSHEPKPDDGCNQQSHMEPPTGPQKTSSKTRHDHPEPLPHLFELFPSQPVSKQKPSLLTKKNHTFPGPSGLTPPTCPIPHSLPPTGRKPRPLEHQFSHISPKFSLKHASEHPQTPTSKATHTRNQNASNQHSQ